MTVAESGSTAATRPSAAIGEAIRRARDGRFSLAELGRRSRTSPGLLSLIERGKGNPSVETLLRISEALGLSIVTLVGASDPSHSSELASRSTALDRDVSRAWDGSIVLREGQEATVRVTVGVVEVSFVDRTRELGPPGGIQRPLSLDLNVRSAETASGSEAIPPVSDPRWIKVIVGLTPFQPTMLACQILFTHVRRSVREDPSASTIDHWIGELRAYFVKYESVSMRELAQIFG